MTRGCNFRVETQRWFRVYLGVINFLLFFPSDSFLVCPTYVHSRLRSRIVSLTPGGGLAATFRRDDSEYSVGKEVRGLY